MAEPVIAVPKTLRGAHSIVRATRDAATGLKPGDDGRLDIGREPGIAHLQVTRQHLNRALRILQAVIAEAERRGYELVSVEKSYNHAAGVGIRLRGETYALKIYELRDKAPLTETEIKKWRDEHSYSWYADKEPPKDKPVTNGRLALAIEHSYGSGRRSDWREGPRGPLEGKLLAFFAELEERAIEDELHTRQVALEREQRERELAAERERQRLAQIEQARGERLSAETKLWRELQDSRAYIASLKDRLDELDAVERERIGAWIDWAEGWIARSDPTINTARIRGLDDPAGVGPGLGRRDNTG